MKNAVHAINKRHFEKGRQVPVSKFSVKNTHKTVLKSDIDL